MFRCSIKRHWYWKKEGPGFHCLPGIRLGGPPPIWPSGPKWWRLCVIPGNRNIALVGKICRAARRLSQCGGGVDTAAFPVTAVDIRWLDAENPDDNAAEALAGVDGILMPGGFGNRGMDGKIAAVLRPGT